MRRWAWKGAQQRKKATTTEAENISIIVCIGTADRQSILNMQKSGHRVQASDRTSNDYNSH